MVGLWRSLPRAAVLPWVLFASLCAMNCICIAVWERWLDVGQRRLSIATEFPGMRELILPLLGVVCAASACLFGRSGNLAIALGGSALLLALVHVASRGLQPDVRTALADLVLLTPLAVLALR
jgi:hypothetical protein